MLCRCAAGVNGGGFDDAARREALRKMKFGAASRRSLALGPGSHSAFAACARESSGWNWRSLSQQHFPGRLQRSEAEWKAIRDPAQELAAKRRRIAPFAKASLHEAFGARNAEGMEAQGSGRAMDFAPRVAG